MQEGAWGRLNRRRATATDIVVIGRRQQKQGGDLNVVSLYLQGAAVGGNQVPGDFNFDGADSGADTVTIAVNVDVVDNGRRRARDQISLGPYI